jgi:hypothetical protein
LSSLSEHERIGLEDVFLCLGEKESVKERISEHKNRLYCSLRLMIKKGVPASFSYVKSKKIMFLRQLNRDKSRLFRQFRPKNRESK